MSPDSGWWSHRALSAQVHTQKHLHKHMHTHTERDNRHTTHIDTLWPCHFVELSHPHQIGQKRSLLTLCCRKKERTEWDNGREKTRRNGEKRHLNDTVIIKGSCSKSKGWKKLIWSTFPKRGIHMYYLHCALVSNDYFPNKWKKRDVGSAVKLSQSTSWGKITCVAVVTDSVSVCVFVCFLIV